MARYKVRERKLDQEFPYAVDDGRKMVMVTTCGSLEEAEALAAKMNNEAAGR